MKSQTFSPLSEHRAGGARPARRQMRADSGISILEVMVALTIFTLASVSFTIGYSVVNSIATRLRCDAAAASVLRAKVAKVLTDPWIPQTVPVDCVVTSGEQQTTADPSDPYDVGPTVVLLSNSDSPQSAFVTGTVYRNTYNFESAAKTVVIEYRVNYTFRGKSYNVYASTIRAADK